jgi:hypothetical protein
VFRGAGECVVTEMHMYQRTARAAVWTGQENEPSAPAGDRDAGAPPSRTVWAKVPFQTRRGRCVAVRCRGQRLWVAISGSPAVKWFPVEQVMTSEEAEHWVSTGF